MSERPLECSECKKTIAVQLTEVIGHHFSRTHMCADCPCANRYANVEGAHPQTDLGEGSAGICCGNCRTTLTGIRTGHPLGCSECYAVFADILCNEIFSPLPIIPMHCGRSVGEGGDISPSLRLFALNEALKETLEREAYEEAARIRDQIKALTEKADGDQ